MISIRRLLLTLIALACGAPAIAQSATAPPQKSDREKDGLRGPVEECSIKDTIPPLKPGDRTLTQSIVLRYNRDGSVYQRIDNGSSESFVYDAQGRELAEVSNDGTEPPIIYTYDPEGRLIAIEGEEDRTTTFEYDEQGRKTRIVKSDVKPSPSSNVSVHGEEVDVHPYGGFFSGVENEDLNGIPPDGGLIRTSFNDSGQATESQVYSAGGRLASRLSFIYDAKGRVAQFLLFETKVEYLLSAEDLARIGEKPATSEDAQSELVSRISYVYDDENRVVEKRDHDRFETTITKTVYNDQGDKTDEVTKSYRGDPSQSKGADVSEPSEAPEPPARFSYEYDSFGNWIEQTVTSADDPSITWSVTYRTITYY